jgi:hypothetical protein
LLWNFRSVPDAWVLEAGSFIGNSAIVWAKAAAANGMNSPVVCIDTWLGDLIMWVKKGDMLGPPGADGQPRLYEQFMLNVASKNLSHRIVPLRTPASIGLQYVHRVTQHGRVPRPCIVYIDTAHTYPETVMELEAAWALVRPGGFLTGDDYTHYFPPVQQSINEFVSRQPPGTFVPPSEYASEWGQVQRNRLVRVLQPGAEDNESAPVAPMVLRLPGQWVLRKPLDGALLPVHRDDHASRTGGGVGRLDATAKKRTALRCCLNGWADPNPLGMCEMRAPNKAGRKACQAKSEAGGPYYTRCRASALPLQQATCALPANRTECIAVFACNSAGGSLGGRSRRAAMAAV